MAGVVGVTRKGLHVPRYSAYSRATARGCPTQNKNKIPHFCIDNQLICGLKIPI
jgi:hypothetical protein